MPNSKDVLVFDDEYTFAAKEIKNYCNALNSMITEYSNAIHNITANAVIDEKIHKQLSNLIVQIESVKPDIDSISSQASKISKEYINEIDKADDFLY